MTIYLDHNATTPICGEAADAMRTAIEVVGNPSSVHSAGRLCRKAIEDAREQVAALTGARPRDVIFTSGGTEANNLALSKLPDETVLLVSAIEHPAVAAARPDTHRIPVTEEGVVDLGALKTMLADVAGNGPDVMVAVMAANNETGVIQPISDVVALAEAHGALVHCDAVQAAGKIELDMMALGVASLAVSGHKIGGPTGTGALILAPGHEVHPLVCGGGQERGRRAGTENVVGIAGFGAAAKVARDNVGKMDRVRALRDAMEAELKAVAEEMQVFGSKEPRLPNTSCLTMPGVDSETQVMNLDLEGFCVSAGSACSSGKVEPSHVLLAMGVEEDPLAWALRVSMGVETEENDVQAFTLAWKSLYARLGHGAIAA